MYNEDSEKPCECSDEIKELQDTCKDLSAMVIMLCIHNGYLPFLLNNIDEFPDNLRNITKAMIKQYSALKNTQTCAHSSDSFLGKIVDTFTDWF